MSFDLGVFGRQNSISDIPLLYQRACESDISKIKACPEMSKFIQLVNELYPDLDSVDESEIESCPWSCGFDQSDRHWIAPIRFPFVKDMFPKILKLANDCSLYLYDPQSDRVVNG